MSHVRRLGNSMSIPLPPDSDGFTGRECPMAECEGYFKIQTGTGLQSDGLPCHCAYCGHTAGHDQFLTKEQIEYAKSIAIRQVTDAFRKDLRGLEFDHRPSGAFGIGFSLRVQPGTPTPIRHYREKQLETEVICVACTLRYAVFGVFAFCPDCGQHNSLQILRKNLDLARKMLAMASTVDSDVAERLVENALEDCVSAFDGFGREFCRVHASKATDPIAAERLSFQNLTVAQERMVHLFGVDMAAATRVDDWNAAVRGFQKRHLLTHKMGVIDEDYVRRSQDPAAVVGRKVAVHPNEVTLLCAGLNSLGQHLHEAIEAKGARA